MKNKANPSALVEGYGTQLIIEADDDPDDIREELQRRYRDNWVISELYDFADIDPYQIGKDIDLFTSLGRSIAKFGEAYAAYANNVGLRQASPESFQDSFEGEFDSEKDFAFQFFDGQMKIDHEKLPFSCIDWEDAWDELEYCGDFYSLPTGKGSVWIYRNI